MTQIIYKHPPGNAPLVAQGVPTAPTIEENLYFPNANLLVRESLEAVNGHLDENNLAPDIRFSRRNIQKGIFTGSGAVGSTANLDFFDGEFNYNKLRTAEWPIAEPEDPGLPTDQGLKNKHIAIPGACCTFYVPESATDKGSVLLSWNIGWFNDGIFRRGSWDEQIGWQQYVANLSRIQLFWDGTPIEVCKRVCPPAASNQSPGGTFLSSRDFARTYSGHKLIKEVEPGWHTAALKISCPNDGGQWLPGEIVEAAGTSRVRQTRVRVRSMRYIWFKNVNDVVP